MNSHLYSRISDTTAWLRSLRNKIWVGQSYAAISELLQKLLFAKMYAENNNKPFHRRNARAMYEEACKVHFDSTGVSMGDLPESLESHQRYDDVIRMIARSSISSDPNIWHIINHLWVNKTLSKDDGQYFTPPIIKNFMCDIYPPDTTSNICDPCGGSGGFLITAASRLKDISARRMYYRDVDERQGIVARRAFATYRHPQTGKSLEDIHQDIGDSLDCDWGCKMDRIYTNVPFGNNVSSQRILSKFDTGRGKKSELSQILFIEKSISQLSDGGCFATVVDRGVVSNTKHQKSRAKLASMAALELVVELPASAFEHFAGTKFTTYLLFFRNAPATSTRYEKVDNIGYNSDGYLIRELEGVGYGAFDFDLEEVNYRESDLYKIYQEWLNRSRTLLDSDHDYAYDTTLTGNWMWGFWRYQNYTGPRLRDVATLVVEEWPGENKLNMTVDRSFRYVRENHLNPQSKTRTLRKDCLLFSRLVSDDHDPACGMVTDKFDGAGCTNENYIIRADATYLRAIWYLINFDRATHDYIRSHCRGQGRSRIVESDLLNMPVRKLTAEEDSMACTVLKNLSVKEKSDDIIKSRLAQLSKTCG